MEALNAEEEEKEKALEKAQKKVEKYCQLSDQTRPFWRDVCIELGDNAAAVLCRLHEKHYKKTGYRKMSLKKWGNATRLANQRANGC